MGRWTDMRTIKQLLEGAEREARSMGEEEPGAEHLLLSALLLPGGEGRRVLRAFGVDHAGLRSAILAQHSEALVGLGIDQERAAGLAAPQPLDPPLGRGLFRSRTSAQEAFRAAAALAHRDGRSGLNGAHVVAAVAAMEHGTAARALEGLGVDRAAIAAAAHAVID